MFDVRWGNQLERLAEAMFEDMLGAAAVTRTPAAVLARRDVIVVPNRLVKHWLLHRFLYRDTDTDRPRILADVEFPLLNVFVNDWLGRMDLTAAAGRDPTAHPFSVPAMRWRLFSLLHSGGLAERDRFAPLLAYVRPHEQGDSAQRAFNMAGRLAAMFDEYMVYRPAMLRRWEQGDDAPVADGALAWQPALWRLLTAGQQRQQTYLHAFFRMATDLERAGVQDAFRAVHVFGASMMPPVYVHFFDLLGDLLPVRLYVLNPCRRDWFDEQRPRESLLEGRLDQAEPLNAGNPFLSDQGRGCRDFLVELLDRTGGQAEAGSLFAEPSAATALGRLQHDLLEGAGEPLDRDGSRADGADGTIQLHVCHSPMRELEVLRDYLLRRFAEGTLHPREIQVQLADLATYAPYIDAVFADTGLRGEMPIPYVVADRMLTGLSRTAEAFRRLLALAGSRFTAPDVLDLLYDEHVRAAFGVSGEDMAVLAAWIEQAGIRWGHDAQHRREVLDVDFDPPPETTWQYGLDRLLLGYLSGSGGESAVAADAPLPCDVTGGDGAVVLGHLAHFHARLSDLAHWVRDPHPVDEWADKLDDVIRSFFVSNDENFRDLHGLRKAVGDLRKSAAAGAFGGCVTASVVRAFLDAQLATAAGGDDLVADAVVFSALRPGSSMPRKVVCLAGMGDGLYPRRENRPHHDLLRKARQMGDRSQRIEDRMAFLEAILSAREHLMISYTGYAAGDGRALPPSVLVEELREYAVSVAGDDDPVLEVRHRLQPFHPAYFAGDANLFTYAAAPGLSGKASSAVADKDASVAMVTGGAPVVADSADSPMQVDLESFLRVVRNPAREYYRTILNVDLEIGPEALPPDSEAFDPDGLDGYRVNRALADGLLAAPPVEIAILKRRLEAEGVLPLSHAGTSWFPPRLQAVRDYLSIDVEGVGPLADALRRQSASEWGAASVAVGDLRIEGRCRPVLLPGAGQPVALDMRWGTLRDEDRFDAWVRHLFACAADVPETRYLIGGRPGRDAKPVQQRLPPLAGEEARVLLVPFAQLYLDGRHGVAPFSPSTAYAYVSGCRREKRPDARETAGLEKARGAWMGDYGDGRNVYYRQAFGEDGPFDPPGAFTALAERLAGPLYDALAT